MIDRANKKEDCVSFSHAPLSLLSTHDDLAMKAVAWFHMVHSEQSIWRGSAIHMPI